MLKRCVRCKYLVEESPYKYYQRIKTGTDTKFYCRKCIKKQDVPYETPKKRKSKEVNKDEEFEKIIKKRKKGLELTEREIFTYGKWLRTGVIEI